MKIINSISEMQRLADTLHQDGKIIGLVPTMGYLHEGHLSLVREAKQRCDVAVMSIFVNPTQFSPHEDLEAYPRDMDRDVELAKTVGCDIVFHPQSSEIYPEGYLTYVQVEKITRLLCGKSRPTHFRGVTTIVAKLFNIVKPHIAVFGQKDAQQALVIRRMVDDLNFDIEIVVAPIVRERDGLAMSSRNTYLSAGQRNQAVALSQALFIAKEEIEEGERDSAALKKIIRNRLSQLPEGEIDYIEIVDTGNLRPVKKLSGEVLVALAVKIGKTRLIDNFIIEVENTGTNHRTIR
ncbi:MAG: pantoate--beta-alanine ligase [Candidatus Zhuqueibacterota bacterium]